MVTESFSPSPSEVSAARHFAQSQANALGCDSDDLSLLVSELATNACIHAGSDFTVSLHRQGSDVLIEVGDQNPAPAVVQPLSTGVSGRGLQIVASIAAEWGVSARHPGKAVWAVLPCR
jgi:anti-sigma regulatory factor (Ser/Thr protein kinase)